MSVHARLKAMGTLFLAAALGSGLVRCSSHGATSGTDGGSDQASPEGGGGACNVEGAGCIPRDAPSDYGLCCAGTCFDIQSDPKNCGGCGLLCPNGTTCVDGFCRPPSCAGAAAADPCALADGGSGSCCDGVCRGSSSFQSDPANCGFCGSGCAAGATCEKGECKLADGGSGSCAEGTDCPSGQSCNSGGQCAAKACGGARAGTVCNLPSTATDPQGICCAGDCVDSYWDNTSCGGCGLACPPGTECLNGTCQTAPSCGPSSWGDFCQVSPGIAGNCCGSACVNLASDSKNCDYCGAACPTGSTCVNGSCVYPGDAGSASCTPPSVGCPPGTLCGSGLCERATCGSTFDFCFLGVGDVTGICCGGQCIDPLQDPKNCGSCGISCSGGICTSPAIPSTTSRGFCVPSGSGGCPGGCPSGETCANGACLDDSCDELKTAFCAVGHGSAGVCCPNATSGATSCVDVATDPANCGGCQVACPKGQTCKDGLCSGAVAPCLAGRTNDGCPLKDGGLGMCCAGGGCSDPESDPQNCGYCGDSCGVGSSCVAGNCQ